MFYIPVEQMDGTLTYIGGFEEYADALLFKADMKDRGFNLYMLPRALPVVELDTPPAGEIISPAFPLELEPKPKRRPIYIPVEIAPKQFVYIGGFTTNAEADAFARQMREAGYLAELYAYPCVYPAHECIGVMDNPWLGESQEAVNSEFRGIGNPPATKLPTIVPPVFPLPF